MKNNNIKRMKKMQVLNDETQQYARGKSFDYKNNTRKKLQDPNRKKRFGEKSNNSKDAYYKKLTEDYSKLESEYNRLLVEANTLRKRQMTQEQNIKRLADQQKKMINEYNNMAKTLNKTLNNVLTTLDKEAKENVKKKK